MIKKPTKKNTLTLKIGMKHKILIFGKNGFIAKELAIFYSNKSKKLKFISKKKLI